MSTAAPVATKSADAQISGKPRSDSESLQNLLAGSSDFGLTLKGLLLVAEEPKLQEGVGKQSGKAYKFYNQRLQVFTGKNTVECTITKDTLEEIPALQLGPVTFRVSRMRMYNSAPIFEVEV